MKKSLIYATLLAVSSASLLTGCSSPEEETNNDTFTVESARAFEDQSDATASPEADDETIIGLTTETKEGNKASKDDMRSLLEAAAFSMEENKDEDGYINEMYYQSLPDVSTLTFMNSLSSNKSFCLRAMSFEFPDLVMYYDSQIKGIVPEGKSCKAPLGKAWGSA